MKKTIFLILGLVLTLNLSAQRDETLFNRGIGLSGAWGGSSFGMTAFKDDVGIMTGGYGGLEFNKNVFIGWGGFETQNDVNFGTNGDSEFDLQYNGLILGYAMGSHRVLHPQFMLLTGGGRARVQGQGSDNVFVLQPSVGVEVNVFRWFRIGLDAGYRVVTNTDLDGLKSTDLSAPYGELKFKFGWSWGR